MGERLVHLTFVLRLVAVALTLLELVADGGRLPVGVAALLVVAGLGSAPLPRWGRTLPLLDRPVVLAADVALAGALLVVAGPSSPSFHYALASALLAGARHGRAGAAGATVGLWVAHAAACLAWAGPAGPSFLVRVGLPALYPVAGLGAAALVAIGQDQQRAAAERAESARRLAGAAERARLARELHDSVTATLLGVSLQARALRAHLGDEQHPLQPAADELCASAQRAAIESRAVLASLRSLPDPTHLGAVLTGAVAEAEQRFGVRPQLRLGARIDAAVPTAALRFELARVVGEALRNAARHAPGAPVEVTAALGGTGHLLLVVRDHGPGFDPAHRLAEAVSHGHVGLVGMRERVGGLGGTLAVVSRPGGGTSVTVRVPFRSGPPQAVAS